MPMAKDEREPQRIRRVYAAYDQKGWAESKWSAANPGNQAIIRERERMVAGLLSSTGFQPLHRRRILEVGCGSGNILRGLLSMGANPENCDGLDLRPEQIAIAKRACDRVRFLVGNAADLPYEDANFDIVVVFTVFSSILDEQTSQKIAREIDRVLRPGGGVLWYDFRFDNPSNPNVRGMKRSGIRHLFPQYRHAYQTLTLIPPLARRLGPLAPALYPVLVKLPILRTHLLGMLTKN